jgi:hypothetical protein
MASLVREATVLALVSVQEAACAAPMTEGPFSSFRWGRVIVGPSRVRERHAWSLGTLYESWNKMQHRFRGTETFVDLRLSSVGSVFLAYEFPSLKVNCPLPCLEAFLPLFQVSKLTLLLH